MLDDWLDLGDLIDRCDELIDLGMYDDALQLLERFGHLYVEEPEICILYGRIHSDRNEPEKSIHWLKKGLSIDKDNVDCLLGLFYVYAMQRKVKRGGRYLTRAAKKQPDNEMVLTALIWYYSEINNSKEAITAFETLQQNGTTNPEAFKNGALAYQRTGNYDKAEHCFKIALELNPGYDEVRDLLADLYLLLGQEKRAVELYQTALRTSPRNIRFLSRLVFCHTQADNFEQAASLAKESIRLYPNSPIGYVDLAYVYLNSNRHAMAIDYADKAHDVSPLDAEAFRIKGIAWSELGEWDKSKKAFETAIRFEPENSEIIRDYYHHLRNTGEVVKMEALVHHVIDVEHPYCLEDYWFLADFYRETDQPVKSFHYLNKAFKTMPAEKELIPPMIDILLERGHTGFSLPFLLRYVGQSGWNETMKDFARHRRFSGKRAQESLRFLRFQGERPGTFRSFIFNRYLEKYLLITMTGFAFMALVPGFLLAGKPGVLIIIVVYVIAMSIVLLLRFLYVKQSTRLK